MSCISQLSYPVTIRNQHRFAKTLYNAKENKNYHTKLFLGRKGWWLADKKLIEEMKQDVAKRSEKHSAKEGEKLKEH
jgi:hypothetical protein